MNKTYTTSCDRSKITEVVLGEGKTVVGHTTNYLGSLAITFSPAPIAGIPGDDYVPNGEYRMDDGAVVLVFKNHESVMAHLERINMMVQDYEEALNK